MITRLARSSLVHVAVAFLAMGGWAVFANHAHAMPQPFVAGAVQGALSGAITFVLKRMIELLASSFAGLAALVLPPTIAVVLSLAILTAIHALAGTPEILATIALPTSVTALYSAIYTAAIWRGGKAA
jgi:hypothetical protein